jgi:predicted kinase
MEFVFMMGLPAAGKSTVASARFSATHTTIDPDAIKESHPQYNPERACDVHEWSMEEAEKRFQQALLTKDTNFIFDGTGTNAESMVRRMTLAKAAGFSVTLFYVKCTIQTSIRREKLRARRVPQFVIREKARSISTSFALIAPYADTITVVDNNVDTF